MEQITRRDGKIFYGEYVCKDVDEAYRRFRDDCHAALGKNAHRRLNAPERTERIHGFHIYFNDAVQRLLDDEFGQPIKKIPYRLIGMLGIAYCRGLSGSDMPDYEEEKYERWFDWFLSHGNMIMRQVGKSDKAGRTSKNKRRFR